MPLVSALVRSTRKSLYDAALALALCVVATMLWTLHSVSWDVGNRSPILDFETSRVAIAARELADRGRLGTTFALPLELASRPRPP